MAILSRSCNELKIILWKNRKIFCKSGPGSSSRCVREIATRTKYCSCSTILKWFHCHTQRTRRTARRDYASTCLPTTTPSYDRDTTPASQSSSTSNLTSTISYSWWASLDEINVYYARMAQRQWYATAKLFKACTAVRNSQFLLVCPHDWWVSLDAGG